MNLFVVFEVLGGLFKEFFTPTADRIEFIHSLFTVAIIVVLLIAVSVVIVMATPLRKYLEVE